MSKVTVVHTDGGWRSGMSGIAWWVSPSQFHAYSKPLATSALAELTAVISGIEEVPGDLRIRTDYTFSAEAATALQLLKRWDAEPKRFQKYYSMELIERFRVATMGRNVTVEYTVSKGPDASQGIVACDLLERYSRRCAVLNDKPYSLDPAVLKVGEENFVQQLKDMLESFPIPFSVAGEWIKAASL